MTTDPITAYPLSWPVGWPRTPKWQRKNSQYSDKTFARVRKEIQTQVKRLGGTDLIISTNISLRRDGLPYSGQKQPEDTGVSIYFNRRGKSLCFANDKWKTVEENAWSICLAIDALRQIERTGASDMLDRAFTGFLALPEPKAMSWWDVLEVSPSADWETVRVAYRRLSKACHPDVEGGSADKFQELAEAYAAAKESFAVPPKQRQAFDGMEEGIQRWRNG